MSFTVGTGLSYNSTGGETVSVYNNSNGLFVGIVTSYNSGSGAMTVLCNYSLGAGNSYSVWNLNLQGYTGATGAAGTAGASGSSGTSGVNGSSGTSGVNGSSGTSGTSGSSGSAGTSGVSGSAGTSGTSGVSIVGPTGATGSGSATTVGVYSIKLEFSAAVLIASPFLSATDPSGNNLIGASGWTFTRVGNAEIQVTHPTGKWFINFNRFAQTSSGGASWVGANISGGSLSAMSVANLTSQASFNIQALATGTGLGGAGTCYMFITWQEPTIDFYV